MTIFLTSDTHFGHANILKYCQRPFADVHEMDRALERNWNSVVSPEDIVFHLGDFALTDLTHARAIFDRLHGVKFLIPGNHDRRRDRTKLSWFAVNEGPFETMIPPGIVEDNQSRMTLSHYPPQTNTWLKLPYFHGHSHGSRGRKDRGVLDVGVDCWDYTPITLERAIKEAFK